MRDFYAYNIRTKKKEKLQDYEVGVMKIKGITTDTSRYFVRGKISDGSQRYVFINEKTYDELKKDGVRNAGTIVKERKEKKHRKKKSKSKSKSGGRSKSRSRSGSKRRKRRSRTKK